MSLYAIQAAGAVDLNKLQLEIRAAGLTVTSLSMSGPEIYVESDPLTESQQATLQTVIQNHQAVTALNYVTDQILAAMTFGQRMIATIGAENGIAGYTVEQTNALVYKYSPIISLLMTGSLKTALQKIEALPPDELVTPERIRKYGNQLRAYLGMPLL